MRTATDVFIERTGDFAELDAYATGDSRKLLVLVAKAGLGKSTLLANWIARFRAREGKPAGETIHARFVGVGEQSSTVDALLRSILEELRRAGKLASEIPDNANVLRSKFAELLGECGKKGRVIVVIDALNQLQSGLADLDWLARTLPDNVKLVVSFKLGDKQGDALAAEMRAAGQVTVSAVQPFTDLQHRRDLVAAYLNQYLKELDEQHLEALIQADGAENPLFLKVVLTELRVFGAFARLGEVIKHEFGTTPQSAFDAVLRRLENDPSYAAVPSRQAVPLLFGLLAHSRGGLPEDLLVRMFLDELGFGEDRSDAMRATIRLLLRQVRPFLARRDGRAGFFYEAFQLAARARYAGRKADLRHWHTRLARACERWADLERAAKRYALGNLVHHEGEAGNGTAAAEGLTEFAYHYERLRTLGRNDVVNVTADFALTESAAGFAPALRERLSVWRAFHDGNAHLLQRHDANLGSENCLLQLAVAHAYTSPVTQSAEAWLDSTGSESHWLRALRRPHDIERTACLRTFEGHSDYVRAVAVLPDQRWAISTGHDGTLRLWALETGECLRTFKGNPGWAVAVLPDGRRAISGGGTPSLWDLETGECLRTFKGHTDWVRAVAVLPDGRRAISGSQDKTLKLWDLQTGECLRTFEGHTNEVNAVAALPDGLRALSGGQDKTLKLWDLETRECLRTFEGHTDGVWAVVLLSSGRQAISGSWDKTLKLWDLETGEVASQDMVAAVAKVLTCGSDWGRFLRASLASAHQANAPRSPLPPLSEKLPGECLRTFEGHTGRGRGCLSRREAGDLGEW